MKRVIFMILAAAAVAGCAKSEEGIDPTAEGVAATFSAESIGSRTTADCLWESGDMIGIFTDGFTSDYTNVCYKVTTLVDAAKTGFEVATAGTEIKFPNVESEVVNFYAYYPYTLDANVDTTAKSLLVSVDNQSTDLGSVDFMTASSSNYGYGVGTAYADVVLSFDHCLAQVVMNISCKEDLSSLEGLTATLEDITTKKEYNYDGTEVTSGSTTTGDISLSVVVDGSDKTKATVTAILHPATYASPTTLVFKVDDRVYSVTFATTLSAGDSHTFNIALGYDITGFESGSTIGGWDSITEQSITSTQSYDIGYSDSKYQIYTAKGLKAFADLVNGVVNTTAYVDTSVITFSTTAKENIKAILHNDIDLSKICGNGIGDWTPIGKSDSTPYSGEFDGNGKKITGLYINNSSDNQGLFGYIDTAVIKNLGVEGSVTGYDSVAGIAGCIISSTISKSYFIGDVSGTYSIGGLVGYTSEPSVSDCYHRGTVGGKKWVGGVVGYLSGSLLPTRCYHVGVVTASESNGGGLVGYGGSTTNCYYDSGVDTAINSENGLSTSVMKTELLGSSYFDNTTDWAYDTENINGGYPVLVVFN